MYEMKDAYLTGIPMIDQEHGRLFEIAEEAFQLKNNGFIADKYDDLRAILIELREYTKMHFEHEEEYMRSINYKKMFTQVVEHRAFIEKLEEFDIESINENSDDLIDEILKFLTDWLIEHIFENDKQIGK